MLILPLRAEIIVVCNVGPGSIKLGVGDVYWWYIQYRTKVDDELLTVRFIALR